MLDDRHPDPVHDPWQDPLRDGHGEAPSENTDQPATDQPTEPNPWLREGADSPDAADIEDPTTQL